MKKLILILALQFSVYGFIQAQNPSPANAQTEITLVMNATAHLGNGQIIQNSVLIFDQGKITVIADATTIRIDKSKFKRVIDAAGKHIYPGFIALNTTIGLAEVDAVRSTRDMYEVGDMNSNVRSIIAYNTDSKIIPTLRSNGVLLAETVPEGGTVSGTSSIVQLDAWNWEDAAVSTDFAMHLNWPSMTIYRASWAQPEEKQIENMNNALQNIEKFFADAYSYSLSTGQEEKNLKLESMRGLFSGKKKLFVDCNSAKEINAAVTFSKKYNMKMVVVGGYDAVRVIPLLKENNIPVVLGRSHATPWRLDEETDYCYTEAVTLMKAGITTAISIDGSWQVRNLAFNAGTTAGYGLSKEEALQTITQMPAIIAGIDQSTGTIEMGKDATFFISSGDALDMRTNHVEHAFINGREISLDNIQKQLNKKYMTKYGLR